MSASVVEEYRDEVEEGSRRIRTGCTVGRIVNLCITLDFFLVMITALIVSGTLGAVNLTFKKSYPDRNGEQSPVPYEVCLLYSECLEPDGGGKCPFHYNRSGVCTYVEVAFGFVALVSLIYIVISVVRAVLTTNISFTVFVDFALIILCLLVSFTTAVIVSIGLSVTCSAVAKHYGDDKTCDRRIPNLLGDGGTPAPNESSGRFYHTVNVSQSCAWLCFAFLAVLLIMTIVRMIIFIKRRRVAAQLNNVEDITDILIRGHYDDEDEDAKPI